MSDNSAFWSTVDQEQKERLETDAKVYKRFLIIPMQDFRVDWYEWATKSIKSIETRMRFLKGIIDERGLDEQAINDMTKLEQRVTRIKESVHNAKRVLDSFLVDDTDNFIVPSSPKNIEKMSDKILETTFNDVLSVMKEIKDVRDQIDLLLAFCKTLDHC